MKLSTLQVLATVLGASLPPQDPFQHIRSLSPDLQFLDFHAEYHRIKAKQSTLSSTNRSRVVYAVERLSKP